MVLKETVLDKGSYFEVREEEAWFDDNEMEPRQRIQKVMKPLSGYLIVQFHSHSDTEDALIEIQKLGIDAEEVSVDDYMNTHMDIGIRIHVSDFKRALDECSFVVYWVLEEKLHWWDLDLFGASDDESLQWLRTSYSSSKVNSRFK